MIESFGGITRVRRTVAAFADWHTGPGISPSRVGGNLHGRDTWFCLFEGVTYPTLLDVAYSGYASNTGIEAVDSLLSKGGFTSMLYAISIVICAMMFGGDEPFTGEALAFAIRKDDPDFLAWLNEFLARLNADGRYERIRGKWFESTDWFSHYRWGRSAGRPVGRRRQA